MGFVKKNLKQLPQSSTKFMSKINLAQNELNFLLRESINFRAIMAEEVASRKFNFYKGASKLDTEKERREQALQELDEIKNYLKNIKHFDVFLAELDNFLRSFVIQEKLLTQIQNMVKSRKNMPDEVLINSYYIIHSYTEILKKDKEIADVLSNKSLIFYLNQHEELSM